MGTFNFVLAIILIVCVLLILVVVVQNSKGGGLASNFSSSNQIMGVRKTADFLEKATWTLAIALLVLSLLTAVIIPKESAATKGSTLQEKIENTAPIDDYQATPEKTE